MGLVLSLRFLALTCTAEFQSEGRALSGTTAFIALTRVRRFFERCVAVLKPLRARIF